MKYVLFVFGESGTPDELKCQSLSSVNVHPGWSGVTLSGAAGDVTMDPSGTPALDELSAVHVVECRDIDHVISMAGSLIGVARVEIRPVIERD